MPGLLTCERMRIILTDGGLIGIVSLDGCVFQGAVTYFDVCSAADDAPDGDKYNTCVVSLGTFRTFTCAVTFDTIQAEVAALLQVPVPNPP